MSLGVIMLVHKDLEQAQKLIHYWNEAGCPLVIHVDKSVPADDLNTFKAALSRLQHISFSPRFRCEWGMWGLVAATQSAAEMMLETYPEVQHVYLASGACMPLRPISELRAHLAAHHDVDFIESARVADVPWTVGGLSKERFTLRFPFSWRKHRRLFDRYVAFLRCIKFKRKIPYGLDPHIGSQWWCLTRKTLTAILNDPQRVELNRYFKKSWIPDESYFQTLARRHSTHIISRSLTLAKFDHQGKPHIFYDDHLPLLRRSDCFVARKIWPHASKLYCAFLTSTPASSLRRDPKPEKIDRLFSQAVDIRKYGRVGLRMQSRFARSDRDRRMTAQPYTVLQGFDDLFNGLLPWLTSVTTAKVHGRLFDPKEVQFCGGETVYQGGLSASASLRNYNPRMFLSNLMWTTRGTYQCLQFSPNDQQDIALEFAYDDHARIHIVTGAWVLPLLSQNLSFEEQRQRAARLQRHEAKFLTLLKSSHIRARLQIQTLAQALETPELVLDTLMTDLPLRAIEPTVARPKLCDTSGLHDLLLKLRDAGMPAYTVGSFQTTKRNTPVIGLPYKEDP